MLKKLIKKYRISAFQVWVFFFFFLAIYLVFNIVSSQLISPIYFKFVGGGKKNTASYLKKIRPLPIFESEYKKYHEVYGDSLADEVFDEENAQKQKIKNLEQILEKNTYSRDILYSLYLLHKEKGDDDVAETYLKQVREIDPSF